MKVTFTTKKESNRKQEEEFLKLAPMERFYRSLRLAEKSKRLFPSKSNREKENNFIIIIKDK